MSNTGSAAPPVFSYAQAARGLQPTAGSAQKSSDVSATSSEKGSRGRQVSSTDVEKVDFQGRSSDATTTTPSPPGIKPIEATHSLPTNGKDLHDSDGSKATKRSESTEEHKSFASPTIDSVSEMEPSSNRHDEEIPLGPNGTSEAWEQQLRSSTSVQKSNSSNEKEKSQTGDDEWEKVSVPTVPQEKELKAAPQPAVNFWQQRMLAQEAKQKEQVSQRPQTSGGKSATASTQATDVAKPKTNERNAGTHEREPNLRRKPSEAAKNASDKASQVQSTPGRPSSRGQPTAQALPLPPPVGDSIAWPTPETAIEADDRRKSVVESNEKSEVKPTGAKQQKKWTQVPFVPTAVFNTPLPPAASKRGGRGGARGGRDGAGRGGHATQNSTSGDKSDMGPPPLPRHAEQDRGRRSHASQGGRATSVPAQGRATSAVGTQTEPARPSGTGRSPVTAMTGEELAFSKTPASRSSSRPRDMAFTETAVGNAETNPPSIATENDHAHPLIDPIARTTISPEWYGGKPTGGNARATGDASNRERGQPKGRNYQESKERVESWRDRNEPQTDANTRRDPRGERGGRGSYRGRGSNSSYVPVGTHANTAPLPQQPFGTQKSQSYHDNRPRQTSSYVPHPTQGGLRINPRSMSGPMQQPLLPSGMPLSPIQTDMSPYQYYPNPMFPGPGFTVPQHPALDVFALMSLVTTQLDYYFSIDNLCHDIYLRKHMDSQGFVSLRVIHGFKRMATMTQDLDTLRYAATQSKVIEIRQGDDGEDRVRRREGWEQWVLANMEDRDPGARNAGPSGQSHQLRRQAYGPFPNFAESPYTMGSPMRSPSWGPTSYNDMSGAIAPGPIPQTIPNEHGMVEQANHFQPSASAINGDHNATMNAAAQQGHSRSSSFVHGHNGTEVAAVTNGHASTSQSADQPNFDQENVFPNDRVSSVWVYARKGGEDGPPFASNSTRTFSQGSRSGVDASINGLASPTKVSGLRGGAVSPEQIQRLHSRDQMTFADGSRQNGTFFLKDGVSQSDFDREGSDPWPYQALLAKALEQHDQGLHGADNHEMEILYQFWPTFLFQNFNVGMYKDFFRFALEDLDHGSTNGSTHLAKYYGYQMAADKPVSDQAAHDIVTAIHRESGEARPVFQKVRAFWRDGAFNFKSRKRINDLLDASMREELAK